MDVAGRQLSMDYVDTAWLKNTIKKRRCYILLFLIFLVLVIVLLKLYEIGSSEEGESIKGSAEVRRNYYEKKTNKGKEAKFKDEK